MRGRALALGGCVLAASLSLLPGLASAQQPADMTVTPSLLSFGSVCVGASSVRSFTIENNGENPLVVDSISRTGSNAYSPTSAGQLAPIAGGQSERFAVTFAPKTRGSKSATYTFEASQPEDTDQGDVSGIGRDRKLSANRSTVTFGDQRVGTRSPTQSLTLTNTGGDSVTINSVTTTGAGRADFRVSPVASSITPGAIATLSIAFQPAHSGFRTAALEIIYSNQWCSKVKILVSLVGTGVVPNISLDPNPVDVGASPKGTPTKPTALTLSNDGRAALKITAIQVLGTDAADFTLTGLPVMPVTVQPAGTLVFSVSMTASDAGLRSATINVISDDPDAPAFSVPLRGSGGAASPSPSATASPGPSSATPTPNATGKSSPQAIAPSNDSLAVGMVVGGVLFAFGGLIVIRRLMAARDEV
jgi:hypothetical protein